MHEVGVVSLTRHLSYPRSVVWTAITDPAVVAKWWAKGDVSPVVGHEFSLDMGAFGTQLCRVLAVQKDGLFVYSFGIGTLDTTITWKLEDHDGETDLTLEHAGFQLDTEMGQRGYQGMRAGWPTVLDGLAKAVVEHGREMGSA